MSGTAARGARRWPRRVAIAVGVVAAAWALLLIPEPDPEIPAGAGRVPFVWDRDELWASLEARFREARRRGCGATAGELDASLRALDAAITAIEATPLGPAAGELEEVERRLFASGPLVAACPARAPEWIASVERMRRAVKEQSARWDRRERAARDRAYRLLYGGRLAIEEVMLQMPRARMPALTRGADEPSAAPSVEVHGVRVHSGDVLISRGGAPTSALIARGNDYPGNFSHIALVHVGRDAASVIESHIEAGVVINTPEAYLADKKLRIVVLRLRADLPEVRARPRLAHEAAERALRDARARHIPYDFPMDWRDHEEQFCSEVASAPYGELGIPLWEGLSSMSSRGVTSWLARFGVEHFETHAPSDLEYDPRMRVVAEWRDPDALWQDHVDNAVIEAMLEEAERGAEVRHAWWLLPIARVLKGWSVLSNAFGEIGPVPEGMSATVALRAQWLAEEHGRRKARLLRRARDYQREHGHRPPYWSLVRLAR